MSRLNRRSGYSLMLAGIAGMVFFWATDPRSPIGRKIMGDGIDVANQAFSGSLVGIAGSAVALVCGLWLVTRSNV